MKKLKYILLLLIVVFLQGCTNNIGVQFHYFQLMKGENDITSSTINNAPYYSKENKDYKITVSVMEYQKVFVLPIEIINKTQNIIEPKNYSIALFDGRDMKPLKQIPKDDIMKLSSGISTSSNIELQVFNSIVNSLNTPFNEKSRLIEYAANNCFEFRPLYVNEKRSGLLLYYMNFREEDPITVSIKINNETCVFKFLPKKI